MKILIIIDKEGTAIWRLADAVKRTLQQHQIKILAVHPKRCDVDTLIEAQKLMQWCDVLDIHYWKSGQLLRTNFPKEFEERPKILFHFNPYDIDNEENQYYDKVVVNNQTMYDQLPSSYFVPMGIDLSFFKFNDNYTEDKVVNMSVARIEGKKGVREVAQVCNELGYKFRLVGRVSKPEYIKEVVKAGGKNIEFIENATDEQLRDVYYSSAVHICNSVDGFESGTLPILECMACGVPVITRTVGHVPELYDGSNMIVRKGNQEDIEDLKTNLKELMENKDLRLKIRKNALKTIRGRDDRKMALQINAFYYSIYRKDFPLVSVIIPTKDKPKSLLGSLIGALTQDYIKYEVIVVDSGSIPVEKIIEEARKRTDIPLRYIWFDGKGEYTLAKARNKGIVEADGEYIVFCDDRIKMEEKAVSSFVAHKKDNVWIWGMKDGAIKGFVENFSFVPRKILIRGGMFNERMDKYGGMTQEIKERYEKLQGVNFVFLEEAKANEVSSSHSKSSKLEDIIEAKFLLYKLYGK